MGYLLLGTTILCEEQKQQHLKEVFAASLLRQGLEFIQAFIERFARVDAFDGLASNDCRGIAGLSLADNTTGCRAPLVLVALSPLMV